jgi:hypothetical protein
VALALDAERAPSLWVVDGVPAGLDLDHVRRLLSPHSTAASVLTTTDASYAELGTSVDVPELPAAQAIRLVLNQVEAPGDRESAHKLVDAVGGHPGALLDLAGSARSAGLDSVRRRLFSRDWPVLEATAKRLLAEVDAAGDAGLDVLRAVTAFAPAPMPLPVLDGLGPVGPAVDRLARQSVVRLVDGGALEVPAVVAHVIRHSDPDPARHERISAAALAARRERDDCAVDERERAAAFRVQVELAHRVPVRPLGGGGLREAISSLHSIFAFTREQLRECGPDSSQRFGEVAERLMEEVLRPFLSEWHPALRRYEDRTQFDDTAWDPTAELRNALDALREPLLAVIRDLSRISGNPHGTRYL